METYDVAILGGGTAGLVAAQVAGADSKRVLLVEGARLGGECTWTGCVPSKALIEAARLRHETVRATQFGILTGDVQVNFPVVMASVRTLIDTISGFEDASHLEARGITVRRGKARFRDAHTIEVDGESIAADRTIVCTGSGPLLPAIPGLADTPYLTSDTLFDLEQLPKHLLILGGGATGLEMGQAFGRLGSKVTVLESSPSILPGDDPDLTDILRGALEREGLEIQLGVQTESAQFREGAFVLTLTREGRYLTVEGDALLVATGKTANIEGLGLDLAGVRTDETGIMVDEHMRTSAETIYAAGDVTGRFHLTTVSAYQGRIAAANAVGKSAQADYRVVPSAVFTDPPLARVGLTEAQARLQHGDVRVTTLPLTAVDRAIINREALGAIKLITGRKPLLGFRGGGEVLGAHIVGARADEVIHEFALAMRSGMFAGRLAQTMHAYPTMAIGVQETAALLFPEGRSIVDLREELEPEQ